jgi:hypothetical protein
VYAAAAVQDGSQWVSAAVEPGTGSSRLLIAGSSGKLHTWDLIANKVTGPVSASVRMRGGGGHQGACGGGQGVSWWWGGGRREKWQAAQQHVAVVVVVIGGGRGGGGGG